MRSTRYASLCGLVALAMIVACPPSFVIPPGEPGSTPDAGRPVPIDTGDVLVSASRTVLTAGDSTRNFARLRAIAATREGDPPQLRWQIGDDRDDGKDGRLLKVEGFDSSDANTHEPIGSEFSTDVIYLAPSAADVGSPRDVVVEVVEAPGARDQILGSLTLQLVPRPAGLLSLDLSVVPPGRTITQNGTVDTAAAGITATPVGGSPFEGGLYDIEWEIDGKPAQTNTRVQEAQLEIVADDVLPGNRSVTVTVTDRVGSTVKDQIVLLVTVPLAVEIGTNPLVPLPGGLFELTATVTGGVPPYNFKWTNPTDPLGEEFKPNDSGQVVSFQIPPDAINVQVTVTVSDRIGNMASRMLGDSPSGRTVGCELRLVEDPVNQMLDCGARAEFRVEATPTLGVLRFQWQRNVDSGFVDVANDGSLISGALAAKLTIEGVALSDAGRYRCLVSDDCGATTSQEGILEVSGGRPIIITQPTEVRSVSCGEPVTFQLFAVNVDLKQGDTYQWQLETAGNRFENLDDNDPSHISGSETRFLTILNAGVEDAGFYRCVVTTKCGTITSDEVILSVVRPVGPEITGQPLPLTVDPGATAEFRVSVPDQSRGTVQFQWQRTGACDSEVFTDLQNGQQASGSLISGAQTDNLVISEVSAGDAGLYHCRVTDACGESFSVDVCLTVN